MTDLDANTQITVYPLTIRLRAAADALEQFGSVTAAVDMVREGVDALEIAHKIVLGHLDETATSHREKPAYSSCLACQLAVAIGELPPSKEGSA